MIWKLRTALFWTHLAVGVVAGLFILNMAVSGISIAYERQVTAFAERDQRIVIVPTGTPRLGIEALVINVQKVRPEARLSGVVFYADPTAATMFYVGRDNNVLYANPYTGEVLGEGNKAVRGFFQFMTTWHRWLALQGSGRAIGQGITGAVSLAYFGMVFSGLCLWLPRQWSGLRVSQGAVLDLKLQGKARDWNWHNTIGLWVSPLLLLVTLTGILMSYTWASNLLYRVTGSPIPEQKLKREDRADSAKGGPAPKLYLDGLNRLWAQAEKQVPGWHSISLRLSASTEAPASFQIDTGDGARPDTVSQLTLDRDTGDVVRWQPYQSQNVGQKLRSWVRPLHTGQAAGWFGETLAVFTALGGILLVWTGLSLAWRRFFGKTKSSSNFPSQPKPNLTHA